MEKELKDETPHYVRDDTYWEGEKDPFPTNPRKDFKYFMGGARGGKFPLLEYWRSLVACAPRDDATQSS